jgi:predicted nucleotidyltransferase
MDPQRLDEIARRHDVELIVQFGSSVSGLMHPGSDVDVAVLYRRLPDSYAGLGDLEADLQALVPARKVDVGVLNHADPLFLKQVMDHAQLLYGSGQRFEQMKLYAFRRYQDHRPYLDLERAYVAREIASRRP